MAERSKEKQDNLLATGDVVLGLPIPDDASETYLKHRALVDQRLAELGQGPLTIEGNDKISEI